MNKEKELIVRPYQLRQILEIEKYFSGNQNQHFVFLELPTGAGKTMTACTWMMRCISKDKNAKIIWITHLNELLVQCLETIGKINSINTYPNNVSEKDIYSIDTYYYPFSEKTFKLTSEGPVYHELEKQLYRKEIEYNEEFSVEDFSTYIYLSYSKVKRKKVIDEFFNDPNAAILLISYTSLNNHLHQYNLPGDFILCIDEAHHSTASTYIDIISRLGVKKMLGLTATPFRMDMKFSDMVEKIGNAFNDSGEQINFDSHILRGISLVDLIEYNYLVKPNFFEIHVGHENMLDKIVDVYTNREDQWGKTMVFIDGVDSAYKLCKKINDRYGTKKAAVITGCTGFEERLNNIKDFRSDRISMLINVKTFCEGFDEPTIKTIFLCTESHSSIKMTQMIGRGLRSSKDKQYCNIVNFNVPLEDLVKKIHIGSSVDEINSVYKLEKYYRTINIGKNCETVHVVSKYLEQIKYLKLWGMSEYSIVGYKDEPTQRRSLVFNIGKELFSFDKQGNKKLVSIPASLKPSVRWMDTAILIIRIPAFRCWIPFI